MAQYYILYNGQQIGPMDKTQLFSYGLNPNSQVWTEGMPQWAAAFTVPELMELINNRPAGTTVPPQAPGVSDPISDTGTSGKSRLAFGLLAIFLGGLGVQYFYAGKITAGILSIVLSLFTCGLWTVLYLVQGILTITMSQDEFERKFVYSNSTFPLF